MNRLLQVSGSPHVHGTETVKKIMWSVVIALVPALAVSVFYYGLPILILTLVSIATCMLTEYLIQRFMLKGNVSITDGSAVITGLLLAFNVPANLPVWILMIGAIVAIAIAKMPFGGLGKNPFNPALVGRVFLLISFPVQMTTWPTVGKWFPMSIDTVSGATPLGVIKEGLTHEGATIQSVIEANNLPSLTEIFLGHMGGSLGEISALAILIGAIYLLIRKIITWHIPVTFIGTAFVFSGILYLCDPTQFLDPLTTILTGGIMLGACFMATDMVTSPMSKGGQLVFGFGCGLLTIIIRNWGAYPEGVSFAILLMNAVTPLINRGFHPKRFAN